MGRIGIIGGGPAGLMAAELLCAQGHAVTLFEAMPSVGRKLLMAGKSGLNLTHGESHAALRTRYGAAPPALLDALDAFTAHDLRAWCDGLGIETFVGSSGRVFPTAMKASPLLRAWLARLVASGLAIRTRQRWVGFEGAALVFDTPAGPAAHTMEAWVLALGGASWPRLGSDAAWVPWLADKGVPIAPFRPANCGFEIAWSPVFAERFAGTPVKAVTATSAVGTLPGEFVIAGFGVEGSLIYAHAAALRDTLLATGTAELVLDLAPQRSAERLAHDLVRQPAKASLANRLRKGTGLDGVKLGLLREVTPDLSTLDPMSLATRIKSLPLPVTRPRPIAQAISVAGGVRWSGLDDSFMLSALPGIFACGEMLDWEAPTGGYLLTGCLATGRAAARGVLAYLGDA